jgi:trehalose synthase
VGGGVATRWMVIDGNDAFFDVTKRIHFLLHGDAADGPTIDEGDRATYDESLAPDAAELAGLVQPGDPVVLHDPQALGLASALRDAGARVIWTCHIGADAPNARTKSTWEFLSPYLAHTDAQTFSRRQHVWPVLDPATVAIIPPCLDAFSAKNQVLDEGAVTAILDASGVLDADNAVEPAFARQDGTHAIVRSRSHTIETGPVPSNAPLVAQVSRWDPLKDHAGVMAAFVSYVDAAIGAHLILAGPDPDAIADDPGSRDTLAGLAQAWEVLPASDRDRVHLASLAMDDLEENAAVVNALQRRADVIVQKSLAEGFGLTVAEAMWKDRPVVGSRVGGIQDQIDHGRTGLLIDDPSDGEALGAGVTTLLRDPDAARKMGTAARERVIQEYLAPCYLTRYLELTLAPPNWV